MVLKCEGWSRITAMRCDDLIHDHVRGGGFEAEGSVTGTPPPLDRGAGRAPCGTLGQRVIVLGRSPPPGNLMIGVRAGCRLDVDLDVEVSSRERSRLIALGKDGKIKNEG